MTIYGLSVSEVIQILVLFVLVVQAYLIRKTLKADHERRKKQATIEFIHAISERYKGALQGFDQVHGSSKVVDISEYSEADIQFVRAYLSEMERLCVGVSIGVFDYHTLREIISWPMMNNHMRFSQYIRSAQQRRARFYRAYDRIVARLKEDDGPDDFGHSTIKHS